MVHIEHGIAQYQGLVRRRTEGGEREYLLLQFAGSDRVYVPTDQLDRVDRYIGVGDHAPALSKLGGAEWERAKSRVKQSVAETAGPCSTSTPPARWPRPRPRSPDNEWQRELEESFPYVETPDQLQAIADVKRDLESAKPMDRLVCGDVGYGKTEVAVRAAVQGGAGRAARWPSWCPPPSWPCSTSRPSGSACRPSRCGWSCSPASAPRRSRRRWWRGSSPGRWTW